MKLRTMKLPERIYRLLLLLYPAQHRAAYGELMSVHFNDLLRDARQRSGWAVSWLWLRTLLDVLATVPAERFALAKEAIMDTSSRSYTEPLPWWQVLLAILPGLAALPGLPGGDFTWLATAGIVLTLVVIAAEWVRTGQFPVWGLLMLGFGGFTALTMLLAFFGSDISAGSVLGPVFAGLLFGLLLAAGLVVANRYRRQYGLPAVLAYLLPLMLLIALATGILLIAGSDSQALNIRLIQTGDPQVREALFMGLWHVAVIIILHSPIMLGLPFARRYGPLALIFVLGFMYPVCNVLIDSAYALGLWTDNSVVLWAVELISPAMLLVAAPLWILRSGSARWRSLGLLLPVGLALLVGIVVPNLVRPYVTWLEWLRDTLTALNMLLLFIVADRLYHYVVLKLESESLLAATE